MPELTGHVEAAAVRWSAATGCQVVVGSEGPRFELADSIVRPDGSEAPGVTDETRTLVQIHRRSREQQKASTTFHELGHVLGGEHTDSIGILSAHKGRVDVIDLPALESVCAKLACAWLTPEG